MKQYWSKENLEDFWKLLPEEKVLLGNKTGIQKFLYLLVLKYYAIDYSFPFIADDIPVDIIEFGVKQYTIEVTSPDIEAFLNNYDSYIKYQREIRNYYGVRTYSETEHKFIKTNLYKIALETINQNKIESETISLFKKYKIEKPSNVLAKNLIKEAIDKVEAYLFKHITDILDKENPRHTTYIDNGLLYLNDESDETIVSFLKQDSGKSNLESISREIRKLEVIRPLNLDPSIIPDDVAPNVLKFYKRKVISDTPEQIRQKPEYIRYPLITIFCYLKRQEIIDNLMDHLCNLVHKFKKKAQKVENALNNQIGRLSHGLDSLYRMARIAYEKPEDIIKDAIYPVVPRDQLEKIIKIRHIQKNMKSDIHKTVIRSYSIYYRKQIFEIIKAIEFSSNNQEILQALRLIIKYENSKREYYPEEEKVIIEKLVNKGDQEFVCGTGNKNGLIRRKDYEYAILKLLKEKLKIKEVWINGSFKYKDPTTDLPKDFCENRKFYYNLLNQPLSSEEFKNCLKSNLEQAVNHLDKTLVKNPHVKVTRRKNKPWIKLSPLLQQSEPQNLERIKEIINKHWNSISLLDVLKEVDLRESFTESFASSGNRKILAKEEIQKRLILCLFAIGTNTGLSRISSGSVNNVTLEELKYIKRKFINQDDLREAITKVVNAIFRIRDITIWGKATTACASDSRKFTSWDQNLMSEWHSRYKGPGVMIYWHVSKQSICIYSQLKTCSSSEVASMLQGIISQSRVKFHKGT